jgi:succinate dehydrogenase hydrophobic membrane anchor protein
MANNIMTNAKNMFLLQRISAVFLLFALPFFIWQFSNLNGYQELKDFVSSYFNIVLLIITSFFLLLHAKIGLHDILLDYIWHEKILKVLLIIADLSLLVLFVWFVYILLL